MPINNHYTKIMYICKEELSQFIKMKIIHNKYFPFGKRYLAINVLGIVFTKGPLSLKQIHHELIHTYQQRELLFFPFFIIYFIEWLFRLVQYHHLYQAYYNISFEREAYENQNNKDYLKSRKKYSWIHYLRHTKSKNNI